MTPHERENTRRLRIYPWGKVSHPSGDFNVDKQFYRDLKQFHDDMKARGYYTPFSFAHKSDGPARETALEEGLNHGRLTNLIDGADGVYADIYGARGVAQLIDDGLVDGLSPTHYTHGFVDPHTGKAYRTGLREVSAVRVQHMKHLPRQSPWYQMNSEAPDDDQWRPITALEEHTEMAQTQTKTSEPTNPAQGDASQQTPDQSAKLDQLIASVTSLSETVTKQGEQITALTSKKTEPVKTPPVTNNGEETPEQKRARELEDRLARTELALKRAEASAQIARRLPTGTLDVVTSLTEAAIVMEPAHLETLLKSQEAALAAAKQAAGANGTTINAEIGVMGNAPMTGNVTREQAYAKARAANIPTGAPTVKWVAQNYPNSR